MHDICELCNLWSSGVKTVLKQIGLGRSQIWTFFDKTNWKFEEVEKLLSQLLSEVIKLIKFYKLFRLLWWVERNKQTFELGKQYKKCKIIKVSKIILSFLSRKRWNEKHFSFIANHLKRDFKSSMKSKNNWSVI